MVRDGAPSRALRRLAVALALSASLHAWVILEMEVSRPSGAARGASSVFEATLLQRTDRDQRVMPVRPPPPERRPRAAHAPKRAAEGAKALPANQLPATPEVQPENPPPEQARPESTPPDPRSTEVPVSDPNGMTGAASEMPGAPTEATGPALQIPLVEDPEFYPARLLDVLPRPLAEVALRYPDAAAAQDISGRVVLLLLIDELGVVVEATVIEAEPPGYFEDAAIESFRDVLFQPAQRNGRAVKSRLPVEVTFDARTDSAKP